MIENKFIWADLSSYEPSKTKVFYENVFHWKYYDDNGYYTAFNKNKQVVGLYQTPLKFKEMKMPSFWMSYIQVENVFKAVEKAKSLGGIIELINKDDSFGNVALIRDTLGAGFTVYDGNQLNFRTTSDENTLIFNELHVSNASKAIDFYQNLFDWRIEKQNDYEFDVFSRSTNNKLASILEIENAVKSKYEYWVCTFGVKNLKETKKRIVKYKGYVVSDEGNRMLCSDGTEAFFYIQEI